MIFGSSQSRSRLYLSIFLLEKVIFFDIVVLWKQEKGNSWVWFLLNIQFDSEKVDENRIFLFFFVEIHDCHLDASWFFQYD